MPKPKVSDLDRLKKKEQELEKTRKEIELRTNIRKAKDYQQKYVDELKKLKEGSRRVKK